MTEKPYRILRIPALNVACYLIYNQKEAILVDTTNKGSGTKVLDMLSDLGLQPSSLKLIVITHSHFDHAGSAREIKELTGARVVVHRSDADELRNGYGPLPDGTRWKAKVLVALGRLFLKRLGRIPPVEPDIIVEDELDLNAYGFRGRVIHTPGHTDGSMVVCLDGGEVIAGDTVFGLKEKEIFPPFADDRQALLKSWERLLDMGAACFYPGHGRKVSREELQNELPLAKIKYGKQI